MLDAAPDTQFIGTRADIQTRKPHGYGFFDWSVEIMLEVRIAVAVDERRASHERYLELLGFFVHPEGIVPVVPAGGKLGRNLWRYLRIPVPC